MAERESGGRLTAVQVEDIRIRLGASVPGVRAEVIADLRRWQGAPVEPDAASAILRAAVRSHPWVPGSVDDVGELLVQLLWAHPHVPAADDLEWAYLAGAERTRRAVLRTWALRADEEALDVVGHLVHLGGPRDLLPVPTDDLLAPLLDVPGVQRLAPTFVTLAWCRGWAGHVGSLLSNMAMRGLLDDDLATAVTEGLAPLVNDLVTTCDRASSSSTPPATARVERRRLEALLPLFAVLDGPLASAVLRRALSSADPRVAASALVALAVRGEDVAAERVGLIARDPEARGLLLDGLTPLGRETTLPEHLRLESALAESDLVRMLASAGELGSAPDEVVHRGVVPSPGGWGAGVVHVFAFRVRPPHWCAERGWMLGAVGPFAAPVGVRHGSPVARRSEGYTSHTLYESEDGNELERHVLLISEAISAARSDGEAA